MGLFDILNQKKMESKSEALNFSEKIEYYNLRDACNLVISEFNRASLPKKAGITDVIRKRIQKTDDRNELFDAFEAMFHRRNDSIAINLSQWIGKKLYDENDPRVTMNDNGFYKLR